jgi:acetyl esterase/lipase
MPSPQAKQLAQMFLDRRAAATARPPTLAESRAGFEQLTAMFPLPADIKTTPVDAAGVPAEWIEAPGGSHTRAVLYLHGGGYVIGSIATHRELCGRIGRAAGARVLAIDYRLAPEHPFPAAVDDAVAAYGWLLQQGLAPEGIAIAGDSAGGGLTAATLVALRDRGARLPAAGILLSPWTDLAMTGESLRTRATLDPLIPGGQGVTSMAQQYLAGADPKTPLASPLYADLGGLPPLLIQVGTSEVLFDDAIRLDARARSAGVAVTLEPWNDMVHVFQLFAGMLPEGQQAIERIGSFVKETTVIPAAV